MTENPPQPIFRRLFGYALDPSLSTKLDTAFVNHIIFKVPWDDYQAAGPVGKYVEVIDYDPASKLFYPPIDLKNRNLIGTDGLSPTESDPQFHQQMVYAVAMTTIGNFEKALGREILWYNANDPKKPLDKLRIYPHAIRDANAYYHRDKGAILFGYFPVSNDSLETQLPKGIVFTCLSHDIITHEVTHAILDGINPQLLDNPTVDSLAFHEAFADIVALFQHFTFPEVLKSQISKTRGDLFRENLLGQLATQFGEAIGKYGSLRDAIGQRDPETGNWMPKLPDPSEFDRTFEPHDRGSILVAAVFDAFIQVYKAKVADLIRINSNGTGILLPGELHPDMVKRLAKEASKVAQIILNMCVRALDFCPPIDFTIGDYLRAIITADFDIASEDIHNFRIAFIEAFRKRGIHPEDIKSYSIDSLKWDKIARPKEKGEKYILEDVFIEYLRGENF